jgi:hypothetical protein
MERVRPLAAIGFRPFFGLQMRRNIKSAASFFIAKNSARAYKSVFTPALVSTRSRFPPARVATM